MPSTSNSTPRYPHQTPYRDLGDAALTPNDLFVLVRRVSDLEADDGEVVDVMQTGADRLEANPDAPDPEVLGIVRAKRAEAVALARDVTRSRVTAWRRRGRPMSWLELRVFLLGLTGRGD